MRFITVLFWLLVTHIATAHAAEREINLGSSASFRYSDLAPEETVTVYGVSRGNSSNPVKITVLGPQSAKVSASAAMVKGSLKSTLTTSGAFYPLPLGTQRELDVYYADCVDLSPGEAASEEEPLDPNSIISMWDPLCDQYSASDIIELGSALSDTYGGAWDSARVCGYIVSVYRGGAGEIPLDPLPASFEARAAAPRSSIVTKEYGTLFSKNACGSVSDRYVFRVKIKLPKAIPRSGYLRVRLSEMQHYGGSEATIKPVSDGMYAPEPLLLMNYLGFCGQRINIVKWKRGKPVSTIAAKVFDLIQYRDLVLTRTPIGSYLTGGEGQLSKGCFL